jgi:hypothetical protein
VAAADAPGVGGFFLQVEVAGGGGNGDGVAGKDVRGLNRAAELNRWRRCDLAEAQDDTSGEAVGVDVADASGDQAGSGWAVVNM